MMSKQDQTDILTVIEAVLDNFFIDLTEPLPPDASKELARTMAYLAKRKQALLAPKPPRKPVSRVQETPRTGTVVPVPDGLKFDTDNAKLKRRRRDE